MFKDEVLQKLKDIDKERNKEANRRYKAKNREKILAKRNAEYQAKKNNPEVKQKTKESYIKNKSKIYEKRKEKLNFINNFKSEKGCFLCGWNKFPQGLDLHHTKNKEFGLAQSVNGKSIEKIREELNKCVVVCAICHRGIHAEILSLPGLTLIEHEHQKH
jgi:hypothetical protein